MIGKRQRQPAALYRANRLRRNWGSSMKEAQTPASSAVDQPELPGIMSLRKNIFPASVTNTEMKHQISGAMVDRPSPTILDGPDFKNMDIATPDPIKETQ